MHSGLSSGPQARAANLLLSARRLPTTDLPREPPRPLRVSGPRRTTHPFPTATERPRVLPRGEGGQEGTCGVAVLSRRAGQGASPRCAASVSPRRAECAHLGPSSRFLPLWAALSLTAAQGATLGTPYRTRCPSAYPS